MEAFIIFFLILLFLGGIFSLKVSIKYQALRCGTSEMNLLGGKVKLIMWEPKQGVVILRNKRVLFTDDKGEGGFRYIYPILGDELRAKVSLATRLLNWEDDAVLTRESLQAHIRVAILWQVVDVRKYTFNIDKSPYKRDEQIALQAEEVSEAWLKTFAESTLRELVSCASIAQLISAAASMYLRMPSQFDGNNIKETDSVSTIAETIAIGFRKELQRKVSPYGIGIERVEILDVQLPVDVQEAVNRVWIAFLRPVQSAQEARARQIELEAAARILGTDTIALNELLKNFQGSTFFAIPPFLRELFGLVENKTQNLHHRSLPNAQK